DRTNVCQANAPPSPHLRCGPPFHLAPQESAYLETVVPPGRPFVTPLSPISAAGPLSSSGPLDPPPSSAPVVLRQHLRSQSPEPIGASCQTDDRTIGRDA